MKDFGEVFEKYINN
ncbi:MAG: YvbH-like oligomerization domain-containing protein [Clostridia bacterium]